MGNRWILLLGFFQLCDAFGGLGGAQQRQPVVDAFPGGIRIQRQGLFELIHGLDLRSGILVERLTEVSCLSQGITLLNSSLRLRGLKAAHQARRRSHHDHTRYYPATVHLFLQTFPFGDPADFIDGHALNLFLQSTGPPDLHGVDPGSGANAHMGALAGLTGIAIAAVNLLDLR